MDFYDLDLLTKFAIEQTSEKKVLIKIPLNSGNWEREYNIDDPIINIINDFKEENKIDISEKILKKFNVKGKTIDMNDKIEILLGNKIFNNNTNSTNFHLIAKPFNNPFEVFVFDKVSKILNVKTFNLDKINSLGLNDYSPSSAYCNGNNHLYISGGESNLNQIIDKFFDIDLDTQDIDGPYDMSPKKNHSMIYISPDKVFIVGGDDKKTFYFDIKQKKFQEWSDLNIIRTEPALQILGNILYCFDNVNKGNNEKLTFERTDIENPAENWELLEPSLDPSIRLDKLSQKFFAVSKDSNEENIIFLGGNMDDSEYLTEIKNYKYNPDLNIIDRSNIPFKEFNYKEKTFLPYNKNIDYLLPDFNRHNPEVTFYVKHKSKFEKVNYLPQRYNKHSINIIPKRRMILKYNFDMPKKENIDKKLKTHMNISANINNLNNGINGLNFNDNNINTDLNIQKIEPYNVPEIQPNKGDEQIKMEIPNNLTNKNKNVIEEEKNAEEHPDKSQNLFEEEKNAEEPSDINKNLKISVNPEINNYDIINNSKQNLDEINIKINAQIDTKENDLNLGNKGHFNIEIPKLGMNNDINISGLNNNQLEVSGDDNLELLVDKIKYKEGENINIEVPSMHLPIKQSININEITSNDKNNQINDKNANLNINVELPSINIENKELKMKKEESINTNTGLKSDIKLGLNADVGDINKNFHFYDTGLIKGKDFIPNELNINGNEKISTQNIKGSANIQIETPKLDIKQNEINKPNLNYNIDGKGIEGGIKADLNNPKINISGNVPKMDIKGSNINIDSPNANIKIPDVKLGDTNLGKTDFELIGIIQGADYNLIKNNLNLDLPEVNKNLGGDIKLNVPKVEISSPNIEGQNININKPGVNLKLDGSIPGTKLTEPNIDLGKMNVDINAKNPDIDINKRKIGMNIEGKDINIKPPELNFESSGIIPGKDFEINAKINGSVEKMKSPNLELKGNLPNMNQEVPGLNKPELNYGLNTNIKGPSLNIETPNINAPNIEVSKNIPSIDIKGPNIDINKSDFNLSGIIPGADYENLKLKADLPSINKDIKGGIDIKGPKVEIESPNIEGPNIDLKGKNIDLKKPELNAKLNTNIPETDINMPNIDTGKIDVNLKQNIPGVDINGPKIDISNNMNLPKTDTNANTPEIKIPENYTFYETGLIKGNDFELLKLNKGELTKDINGSTNIQIGGNLPNIDIKGKEITKPDLNYNIDGKGIDLKADIKSPNVNIEGNVPNIDIKGPKMNIETPNINAPNIEVSKNIPSIDIKGPNIDINKSDFNLSGIIPGADYENLKLKADLPSINKDIKGGIDIKGPKVDIESPNIEGPNIDLKGKNIDLKKPDINMNVEGNINGTKLKTPNIDINKGDINLDINKSIPKVDINTPKLGMDINIPKIKTEGGNINGPELDYNIGGIIPSTNLEIGNENLKGSRRIYDYDINIPDIQANSSSLKLHNFKSDYELKGPRKLNLSSNKNMKGEFPSINLNAPNLNSNLDLKGSIKGSKIDIPNLNADIKMPNVSIPKVDIKGKNDFEMSGIIEGTDYKNLNLEVKGPKTDINLNKPEVNINAPNIKEPKVNIETNGPEVNLPSIDIPQSKCDFYVSGIIIGTEIPKINGKDKDINVKINKPNINLDKPEIKIDGSLKKPDFDINQPGLKIDGSLKKPDFDINQPGLKIDGNISGIENNKEIKMPSANINLNGENLNVPNIGLDAKIPNININNDKNINIPSGDINLKDNIDVNGNIELPSGDLKLKGPKIKNPEININGSSPNIEINGPKIETNLGDIKIEKPKLDTDANLKVDLKNNINKLDTEINPGNVNFNLGLEGNKKPDIQYDFYLDGIIIGNDSNKEKQEIKNSKNLEINNKGDYALNIKGSGGINQENDINLKGSRRLINGEYNINTPNVNLKSSKIKINQPEFNLKGSRRLDINGSNLEGNLKGSRILYVNQINSSVNRPENTSGININSQNLQINPGDINIKGNIGDINPKVEGNIEIPNIDVNINNKNDINNPSSSQVVNLEVKNFNLLSGQNDINISPNIDIKNSIEAPKGNIRINIPQLNFNVNANIEENNDNKGYANKKAKGLPKVGNKDTSFKASKIDVGGKFDVNNVNTDNLQNANVGVGGIKMGERIND